MRDRILCRLLEFVRCLIEQREVTMTVVVRDIYCLLELNMLCNCVLRGCGDHDGLDLGMAKEKEIRPIYCLLEYILFIGIRYAV